MMLQVLVPGGNAARVLAYPEAARMKCPRRGVAGGGVRCGRDSLSPREIVSLRIFVNRQRSQRRGYTFPVDAGQLPRG